MYDYQGVVTQVHDGDTITVRIDLGFDIWHVIKVRLAGIDAPELTTAEGQVAADHLKQVLGYTDNAVGPVVRIVTQKDKTEKYGRYLATIYVNGANANQKMVEDGFAKVYSGGKRT